MYTECSLEYIPNLLATIKRSEYNITVIYSLNN